VIKQYKIKHIPMAFTIEEKIKEFELVLQDQTLSDSERDLFQKQLDKLKAASSGAQPANNLAGTMQALMQALQSKVGISEDEVRQIAQSVFASSKIGKSQLDNDLLEYIDATRKMVVNVSLTTAGKTITSSSKMQGGNRALFYVMMSDFAAGNNVYLYGPAGTGKTFMAKVVAEAVGYKVITINCNQYTSPIELIGGQTIEGYQEGKLIRAWEADPKELGINPKTGLPYTGALLLIDELPKLDPNTAGIMNDALSVIKDPVRIGVDGEPIPKKIMSGRNKEVPKGNIFVVATGNTLLLRPDPTYTANFAQDASLQDRFAGSTYRVFYDYELEYTNVFESVNIDMGAGNVATVNMAFLFNFLIALRESIETNGYTNEAFISMRLMNNLRDTYVEYRRNDMLPKSEQNTRPKTLQDGINSFLNLFTDQQRTNLIPQEVTEFLENTIPDVNSRPLDELSTPQDIEAAKQIVAKWKVDFGDRIL
jgi:MoxR-like ATPase